MSDLNLLSHFRKKQQWMASHVEQAQYPTQESQAGLALYKNAETQPLDCPPSVTTVDSQLSFYNVDCHPLMVRYAKTLARKWTDDDHHLALEFLTQISLTDLPAPEGQEVALWLAMEKGTPVATGMLFSSEEEIGKVTGIYDVFGLTTDACEAMKSHLLALSEAEKTVFSQ